MLKFAEYIKQFESNTYHDFVSYCENNNVEINEANFKDYLRAAGAGAVAASALAGGAKAADYTPGPAMRVLHQAAGVEHQKSPNFVMHVSEKGILTDAGGRPITPNSLPPAFANKFGSFSKVIAGILKNNNKIERIELVSTPQPAINVIDIYGNATLVKVNFR
jgi:hypothetical protein